MRRGWAALIVVAASLVVASSANAAPIFQENGHPPVSVEEMANQYAAQYHDSHADALRRMEIDQRAIGLEEELSASLGRDYGGMWLDPATGDVRVGILSTSDDSAATAVLSKHGLAPTDALVRVKASLADLEAAQYSMATDLRPAMDEGVSSIRIDVPRNRVITVLSPHATARVKQLVSEQATAFAAGRDAYGPPLPPVDPTPYTSSQGSTAPQPARRVVADIATETGPDEPARAESCGSETCSLPLRAGVRIEAEQAACSAGFVSTWWSGKETIFFIMDAGHCIAFEGSSRYWYSKPYPSSNAQPIGQHWSWRFGNCCGEPSWQNGKTEFDASIIEMGYAYYWTDVLAPGPLWMHGWPTGSEWEINREARPYVGEYGCRSGFRTVYTCGHVAADDAVVTLEAPGGSGKFVTVYNELEVNGPCTNEGDSGGPFVDGGTALGVLSGGSSNCTSWYGKVVDIKYWFGVAVYL